MQGNTRVTGVDRRRFLGFGLAGVALAAIGCDNSGAPQQADTTVPAKQGGARKLLDRIKDKGEAVPEKKK